MADLKQVIADRLQRECLAVFGSAWTDPVAERFAAAALAEVESYDPLAHLLDCFRKDEDGADVLRRELERSVSASFPPVRRS